MKAWVAARVYLVEEAGEMVFKNKLHFYPNGGLDFQHGLGEDSNGNQLIWTMCLVSATDYALVKNDPDIIQFPSTAYSTQMSGLSTNAIGLMEEVAKAINYPHNPGEPSYRGTDTFGTVVDLFGKSVWSNFSIASFPL